jgi:hypothetical protein
MENLFNRSEHSGAGRAARVQLALVHATPPARSSSKSNALDQGAQRTATMAISPVGQGCACRSISRIALLWAFLGVVVAWWFKPVFPESQDLIYH